MQQIFHLYCFNQLLNMLINKLVHKLVSAQLRYNPVFLFAAENKADKPKQATKAPKAGGKSKKQAPQKSQAVLKKQAQKFELDKKFAQTLLASKTKTGSFYRDIIREANVNKLTQKAKFNDESLLILINGSQKKDINIIHEAYFNYLGHNTPILNKTVDTLVTRTILLASQDSENIEENLKRVFDIYKNHQYLGYFPHYETTIKVAKFAASNGKLSLFIETLKDKLLIKLDARTIGELFQLTKQWLDFTKLFKILMFRFNRGLITDVSKQRFLSYLFKAARDTQKIYPISQSKQYKKFLTSFENPFIDLAIAWVVVKDREAKAVEVLKKIQDKHPRLPSFCDIVAKLDAQKSEKPVTEKLKSLLVESPHQQLFK